VAGLCRPRQKRWWFVDSDAGITAEYRRDLREGGSEFWRGTMSGTPEFVIQASHLDVVQAARIISAYQIHIGGTRISASIQTIELAPKNGGTLLKLT
jgi:uncharacterized protein YndB with AHSA1/START domain